ncbi:MAG: peptidase M14 [Ectothiorhodospiraceae bacterium]|nr:peptidase M14 [Ectothiorhodospiraceae bacterium]
MKYSPIVQHHLFFLLAFIIVAGCGSQEVDWETPFEKSGGMKSPRYEETYAYLDRMAEATPWVQTKYFGETPEGRPLMVAVLSKHGAFTPAASRALGKPVVLIFAGIHSGEIDGKDAGMMLFREIAITKKLEQLADSVTILFIPIFNLDGHERQSRYNRINQDGPEEMGWRTTSQYYNLNRDFLKADAPEMRAWLALFNDWLPEVAIDCHVTDGIDFQYNITYAMEMYENASPPIVTWQKGLIKSMTEGMEERGDPIYPYVFPRERKDLSQGIVTYAAPPRFSTGYIAIRNRCGILLEAHSLKPFKTRVYSMYHLLIEILEHANTSATDLLNAAIEADRRSSARFQSISDSADFPIRMTRTQQTDTVEYHTYPVEQRTSTLTGGTYPVWDHTNPVTLRVPYYNDVVAERYVRIPTCYFIPQEWKPQLDVLRAHDVKLHRLTDTLSVDIETYYFTNEKWRESPYEGRHPVSFDSEVIKRRIYYPAGTYVVWLEQQAAQAAIHLLEPDAPDSFVFWGFFDGIFERKEYFETYAMEPLALKMLEEQPNLRSEFEDYLAAHPEAADDQRAQLMFFYQRSPYWDAKKNVYPVGKLMDYVRVPSVPENEYQHPYRNY